MTSQMTKALLQFCCIYRKGCYPLLGHKLRANDVVFFYPISARSPELDCDRDVLPDLG